MKDNQATAYKPVQLDSWELIQVILPKDRFMSLTYFNQNLSTCFFTQKINSC